MPRSKRQIEHAVTVRGAALVWRLHREQQLCGEEGWKGVAIHVTVAEGTRRELHLEYPAAKTQKIGYTRSDRAVINIRPSRVEEHIAQAMDAGWDPDSRGKPFIWVLDELPN
jgi:hypothetical protein